MLGLRLVALATLLCLAGSGLVAQSSNFPGGPTGTSPLPTNPGNTTTTASGGSDESDVTPPPSAVPTLPATAKRTNLMISRGQGEIEVRTSMSHFSKSTVFVDGVAMLPVMVVGDIGVERSRNDMLISAISARYGVMDNLQAELKLPLRYQTNRRSVPDTSPAQEATVRGLGIGDIEGGVYYQLPKGAADLTRWVVSAGMKSATGRDTFSIDQEKEVALGTGFWSSKFGISAVKVVDPAALFWSAGYTYNWERRNIRYVTEDQTTGDKTVNYINIKPGNSFDIGGGFAYALNPQLSLNTGVSVSFSGASSSDGKPIANTAVTSAALRLGMVYLNGSGKNKQPIDIAISMGLTEDSPDFTVEFRQTFSF